MRPEIEIILLALRSALKADEDKRLTALLNEDIDWYLLSVLAVGHRCCPPVADLLEKHGVDRNLTHLIRQASRKIRSEGKQLPERIFRLQESLREAKVDFVFVKCAFFTDLLYETVRTRLFSDVDLVVDVKDIPIVAGVLEKEGLHPCPLTSTQMHENQFFRSNVFLKLAYHKEYASADNTFLVDLHWRPGTWFATTRQVLDHAVEQSIDSRSYRTLEPDLNFIAACARAAKHNWETLAWILDIAWAMKSEGHFNWRKVARLSRKLGLFQTVQVSVCLANRLLDVRIPLEFQPISEDLERLTSTIVERYNTVVPPTMSVSKIPQWRRIWKTFDSKSQVVEQVALDLFCPTYDDWSRFRLPENLFWLYSLIRPASKIYFASGNLLRRAQNTPNRNLPGLSDNAPDPERDRAMWKQISAGAKFSDTKEISGHYKRVLINQLFGQAVGEYAGGLAYKEWLDRAPDAVSKARLEKLSNDEFKHARLIMALLEPFGFNLKELEDGCATRAVNLFLKPIETWSELVAFNLLADGAADHFLHDYCQCSWEPWCNAMELIEADEEDHLENGDVWIEDAARDPARKQEVQDAIEDWLPRVGTVFGRSSFYHQEACIFQIRLRDQDEVRKLWHEELKAKLHKIGYEIPIYLKDGGK